MKYTSLLALTDQVFDISSKSRLFLKRVVLRFPQAFLGCLVLSPFTHTTAQPSSKTVFSPLCGQWREFVQVPFSKGVRRVSTLALWLFLSLPGASVVSYKIITPNYVGRYLCIPFKIFFQSEGITLESKLLIFLDSPK